MDGILTNKGNERERKKGRMDSKSGMMQKNIACSDEYQFLLDAWLVFCLKPWLPAS